MIGYLVADTKSCIAPANADEQMNEYYLYCFLISVK